MNRCQNDPSVYCHARSSGQPQRLSQQPRHIYTMFDQCWANVVDGGPILVKHWVDASCLLGELLIPVTILAATRCSNNFDLLLGKSGHHTIHRATSSSTSIVPFHLHRAGNYPGKDVRRSNNVGLLLGKRRRRWANHCQHHEHGLNVSCYLSIRGIRQSTIISVTTSQQKKEIDQKLC